MTIFGVESDTCKPDSSARRHKLVAQDPRGRRYELRSALLREYGPDVRETNQGLCECGSPLMIENGVVVRRAGDSAGFAGVKSCGRATVCPVCAAKVGAHRAGEISQVVDHFQKKGGTVAMFTFTMRHHRGQSLNDLWCALSAAWKSATNGRGWRRERQSHGIGGYVRAVEATHGDAGWHLHVHALLIFDAVVTDETIRTLAEAMFGRWSATLQGCGLDAPTLAHGIDWKRVGKRSDECDVLASYLTKIASGVGFEVGGSTEKKGRRAGNRSPWQIAQDAVSGEDETRRKQSLALWLEWLKVSKGRRMLTWSAGLRDVVGMDQELTDEQAANQTIEGDAVAVIPAKSWGLMRTRYPHLLGDVLRLTEGGHGWKNLHQLVQRTDRRLRIEPAPDPVRDWIREGQPVQVLVSAESSEVVLSAGAARI